HTLSHTHTHTHSHTLTHIHTHSHTHTLSHTHTHTHTHHSNGLWDVKVRFIFLSEEHVLAGVCVEIMCPAHEVMDSRLQCSGSSCFSASLGEGGGGAHIFT